MLELRRRRMLETAEMGGRWGLKDRVKDETDGERVGPSVRLIEKPICATL